MEQNANRLLMTDTEVKNLVNSFRIRYAETCEPIQINFRELVSNLNSSERYTHLIHSYPAKLLCHIPYFFLQTDYFCPKTGTVLDPFCGTGTVLLEANISGREAKGADANPLARLISRVKTTYIKTEKLQKTLTTLVQSAKRAKVIEVHDYSSISRWFSPSTIDQLLRLELAIEKLKETEVKEFFLLCLSNLVKKVSFADPCISVPVRLNPDRFAKNPEKRESLLFKLKTLENIDVYDKFESVCSLNINRIEKLRNIYGGDVKSEIVSSDARCITKQIGNDEKLPDKSIDLILTSPPYAGAQKYIRSSWLNLYWLGTKDNEEIRELNKKNIGREDYVKSEIYEIKTGIDSADRVLNSLYNEGKYERAFIVGNYLKEMLEALGESIRVLKDGGYLVIIIGNNTVCGRPFDTQDYFTEYVLSQGLSLEFKLIDDIKSYGLMTKRNKTASRISSEWILVFKK